MKFKQVEFTASFPNGKDRTMKGYKVLDEEGNDLAPGWVVHKRLPIPHRADGWILTHVPTGFAANEKAADSTRKRSAKRLLMLMNIIPESYRWTHFEDTKSLTEEEHGEVLEVLLADDEVVDNAWELMLDKYLISGRGM